MGHINKKSCRDSDPFVVHEQSKFATVVSRNLNTVPFQMRLSISIPIIILLIYKARNV